MSELLFFVGVSMLLLHEMDAIDKKEWRLLFVLRKLDNGAALQWFITLHLPLLVGLFILAGAGDTATVRWIQGSVDAFLIVHAGLHERLARGDGAVFANPFSRALIWGAGAVGAVHLAYLIF